MKRIFSLFLTVFCVVVSFAQNLKLEHTYTAIFDIWDVDPLGNVIYAKSDALYKLDTAFAVQFKQSFKFFGNITSIDATHNQKTLIFSDEMQHISFLDNTLTSTSGNKSLEDLDIFYAKFVCFSQISTRFWVYDDINSKLLRFDEGKKEPVVVENLNLLLNEIELVDFFESNNNLYLITKNKGVYVFDNFGTLINRIENIETKSLDVVNGDIFYIEDNYLIKRRKDGLETKLTLPEEGILDFKVLGQYVYFKSSDSLKKYSLKKG